MLEIGGDKVSSDAELLKTQQDIAQLNLNTQRGLQHITGENQAGGYRKRKRSRGRRSRGKRSRGRGRRSRGKRSRGKSKCGCSKKRTRRRR